MIDTIRLFKIMQNDSQHKGVALERVGGGREKERDVVGFASFLETRAASWGSKQAFEWRPKQQVAGLALLACQRKLEPVFVHKICPSLRVQAQLPVATCRLGLGFFGWRRRHVILDRVAAAGGFLASCLAS